MPARAGAVPGHPPALHSHGCSACGLDVLSVLLKALPESNTEDK